MIDPTDVPCHNLVAEAWNDVDERGAGPRPGKEPPDEPTPGDHGPDPDEPLDEREAIDELWW